MRLKSTYPILFKNATTNNNILNYNKYKKEFFRKRKKKEETRVNPLGNIITKATHVLVIF